MLLTLIITLRSLLWWRTIRTVHCAWDGVHSLLPFALTVLELVTTPPSLLPWSENGKAPSRTMPGISIIARHTTLALIWAAAAVNTLLRSSPTSGAICPPGLWERMIPLGQVLLVACDALILAYLAQLRRGREDPGSAWRLLAPVLVKSAAVLSFLSVWSFLNVTNYRWDTRLDDVAVRHLLLDSGMVAVGLLAAVYLLADFDPMVVGTTMVTASLFAHIQLKILDGTMARVWSDWRGVATGAVLFPSTLSMLHTAPPAPGLKRTEKPLYRSRFSGITLGVFLVTMWETVLFRGDDAPVAISDILSQADAASNSWTQQAKQSKGLEEAVEQYRSRYGIPPPPNFDKWYEYAVGVQSPIIDDFGQINSDLLPFWGMSPALIRQRTVHLLGRPALSFGGLVIERGNVTISPHVPGTHRWMMEAMKTMIEPFAHWLPDMQIAFNLDDECRVAVPFERMMSYRDEGLKTRARLAKASPLLAFASSTNANDQEAAWPSEHLSADKDAWKQDSVWFTESSKSPIFYDWVASTCPAGSAVHKFHWWNRNAVCGRCSAPHMPGGLVTNWTRSGDLCHQPDLAYLHGVLLAPSVMRATDELFPVFSQSRISSFADILHPSPWNFADKIVSEDLHYSRWQDKLNSVFWRGALSDGYAHHGSWQTFLRARFVHMANKAAPAQRPSSLDLTNSSFVMNVSFVGDFNRCDQRDCALERAVFFGSSVATPSPSLDFAEHWRHRHLVDMDGAGFSGRFIAFVMSASLPYRSALFRTWWEERVHAWHHFVPLDVRLNDLFRLLDYFGGGTKGGSSNGEKIATQGRLWAKKALRKEDMRVYMFRLLLEWARVVDDGRETLGFAG